MSVNAIFGTETRDNETIASEVTHRVISPVGDEVTATRPSTTIKSSEGKNRKVSTKGKAKASKTSVKNDKDSATTASSSNDNSRDEDIKEIKNQLKQIMGLVPIINELKGAYDEFNEDEDNDKSKRHGLDFSRSSSSHDVEGNNDEVPPDCSRSVLEHHSDCDEDGMINPAESASHDQGILDYFSQVVGTKKETGVTIAPNIAAGVTKVLREGIGKDTLLDLIKKYPTPDNCERINTIQCNEEIFKHAKSTCRGREGSLQKIQNVLMKGLTACALTMGSLTNTPELESISDAVALIAQASHELDIFRRESFKYHLKEEYGSLCTSSYPVEGKLFGSNIHEKLKELNDTLRIARATRRFQPYNTNKRFPFLGKSHSWKTRGGGDYATKMNRQTKGQNGSQRRQQQNFPRRRM